MRWPFILIILLFPLLLLAQISSFEADSAYRYIEHLSVMIGPRPMGSLNEQIALNWTEKKFDQFKADSVYILHFYKYRYLNTQSGIAVGLFRGQTDSAIVIGSHIDSADPEVPGANDNASGCASMIELARIWSQRERHYTMIFVAFGGEEQGLAGSTYFVENDPIIENVQLMLCLDMTAADDEIFLMFESKDFQSPQWLLKDVFSLADDCSIEKLSYPTHFFTLNNLSRRGPGSDHIPFLNKKIPAIDFSVGVEKSPIHTQQDNINYIDKNMLATTGLLVDRLLQKYQIDGIPQSTSDQFLLWEFAGKIFTFPFWLIIVFNCVSFVFGIAAFILSYRQRILTEKAKSIKYSGLKLLLFLLLFAISVQLGEAILQLISGYRYPWFINVEAYLIYAAIWLAAGFWVAMRLTTHWQFSPDPNIYANRALIIFLIFLTSFLFLNMRLALYPAISLFFFSLAVFLPQPWIKVILIAASPLPYLRLMFTEVFYAFPARMSTYTGFFIDSSFEAFLYSLFLILILVLWYLPFIYNGAYLVVSVEQVKRGLKIIRRPIVAVIIIFVIVVFGIYLLTLPVYSDKWRQSVLIESAYDIKEKESKLIIRSNEYLKDIFVKTEYAEYLLSNRSNKMEIPVTFTADWIKVNQDNDSVMVTDSLFTIDWLFISQKPWIRFNLKLRANSGKILGINSNLAYRHKSNSLEMSWYANPPDTIHCLAELIISPGTRLIREVKAEFKETPLPLIVTSSLAQLKYSTAVIYRDTLNTYY